MRYGLMSLGFAVAAVFLVFAQGQQPARAQGADVVSQEVNSLFDGLCLAYLGRGQDMLDQAQSIGAKQIPQFFAQQFLGKHAGVAVTIQGQGSLYMLGLTEQPACVIAAPEANGVAVSKAFAAGAQRLPMTHGVVDGQYQQVYAVIRKDAVTGQQKRMIVTVVISPNQSTPGVVMTALPAVTAAALGMKPDAWPEVSAE
ncbi:MAG: hypothetical protein RBS08_03465 [Bdellovibrionales bacterium]|jgi:hypothetical protein|nr:hypothetical protein [Bdellovibrionales bacterium]